MNPYMFFVGCSRSGTTLLRRVADAHPALAVLPEQHWLPRFWEWRVGIDADGMVTPDLLDLLLADRRFIGLELPFTPLADLIERGPPLHYAAFVTQVFDLYARTKGKGLAGEKTPKYARYIPTLSRLWPEARFVHLIRDGRDVALSLLDWEKSERNVGRFPGWEADRVTTAALYWEWTVRLGRESGRQLGADRYLEMRYERLVEDPVGESERLAAFLGLGFDLGMLRFHEGRSKDAIGLSAKKSWLPITAGLRSWRDQMAPADVSRFEAASGMLLQELGYETASEAQDADREAAVLARAAFAAHAQDRGGIPDAWAPAD